MVNGQSSNVKLNSLKFYNFSNCTVFCSFVLKCVHLNSIECGKIMYGVELDGAVNWIMWRKHSKLK